MKLRENKFFLGILVLVLVDQLVKWAYRRADFVVLNSGVSFGLFSFNDFWIVSCVLIITFVLFFVKEKSFGLMLVVAGGIGNLIDRVILGGVVDHWQIFNLWFNLSDLLINIGVLLIFWYEYRPVDKYNL